MITYCSTVRPSYSQMKRTPQVGRESVQITAMKSNESDHHSLEWITERNRYKKAARKLLFLKVSGNSTGRNIEGHPMCTNGNPLDFRSPSFRGNGVRRIVLETGFLSNPFYVRRLIQWFAQNAFCSKIVVNRNTGARRYTVCKIKEKFWLQTTSVLCVFSYISQMVS